MPSGKRSKRGNRGHARGEPTARNSGDNPTPTSTNNEPFPSANVRLTSEEDIAKAVCWICAEPVKYYSLSACNHRTCHLCALRLRVLYGKLECTFCKEPQSTIIITTSPDGDFSSYTPNLIPHKDAKLSIFFETEDMMKETLTLLQFNCPSIGCDYTASGWSDLKLHARTAHGKVLCDLCIQFKKVFVHEHTLYLPNVLPFHLPSMPQRPRKQPLNKTTIECGIHPLCEFCNECFFGDDELFVHMRERHEECFLCKQREIRHQYFQNFDSLELHFSQSHFSCSDPICKDQKFVVFDSGLDLNAHCLEVHPENASPKDKKDSWRVQVESELGYTGSGSRRGQDRADREPVRKPLPRLVQTRGCITGMPTEVVQSESTQTTQHSVSNGRAISITTTKIGCRTNESSAHGLVSTVWNTVNQNFDDTAGIINAMVDFLEEEEKIYELLTAWNEFKLDSEQRRRSSDFVPSVTGSIYARMTNGCMTETTPGYSQLGQSPRLEHHAAQTPSPPSASSRVVPGASFPALAAPDTAQHDAFPHLIRPFTNISATPQTQTHRSQQFNSWASVAARLTSKKTDGACQPIMLSSTQNQPSSPSSAGLSTDANGVFPFYNYPPESPQSWVSLASTDLSAWTANWDGHKGEGAATISGGTWRDLETQTFAPMSERSEMTMGQGKKGKGKQRQRLF